MKPGRCLLVLPGLLLAGCGGATRSAVPKTPEAPAEAPGPAGGYAAPPSSMQQQEPAKGAPPAAKDDRDLDQPMPTLEDALSTFNQAQARLSASGNNCRTACRALGSMRRSADCICDLEPAEPQNRCERARRRLRDAEKRVHSGCGEC